MVAWLPALPVKKPEIVILGALHDGGKILPRAGVVLGNA